MQHVAARQPTHFVVAGMHLHIVCMERYRHMHAYMYQAKPPTDRVTSSAMTIKSCSLLLLLLNILMDGFFCASPLASWPAASLYQQRSAFTNLHRLHRYTYVYKCVYIYANVQKHVYVCVYM